MAQPIRFDKYPPYVLNMNDNGTIIVRSGDMLSKYNWAMYGNYGNAAAWAKFKRVQPSGALMDITNPNLISAGEVLAHVDYYSKGPANGGPVGTNPPTGPGVDPAPGGGKPIEVPAELVIDVNNIGLGSRSIRYLQLAGAMSMHGKVGGDSTIVTVRNLTSIQTHVANYLFTQLANQMAMQSGLDQLAPAAKEAQPQAFSDSLIRYSKGIIETRARPTGWGPITWQLGFTFEKSMTPAVAMLIFTVDHVPVEYQGFIVYITGSIQLKLKAGLTRDGWIWLVDEVGPRAVQALTEMITMELALQVAAWAGYTLVAAVAMLATSWLDSWLVRNAIDRGEKQTAAWYYGLAYAEAVFDQSPHKLNRSQEDSALLRSMVETASKDVAADMRAAGLSVPQLPEPVYSYPGGMPSSYWRPASAALDAYARYIVAAEQTDRETARNRLMVSARQKAESRMGV